MVTGAGSKLQKAVAIVCVLLLPSSLSFGQAPAGPLQGSPVTQQPALSPDQLDNLVAPVALYPDPLLGQLLAASTYPLEIVEVQQWLQQNKNLQGSQLVDAAKQQNWDPSVQTLVAFPDALSLLSNDIRWTTDLGNAFLAQQADVMTAVQRMRARAQANGKLTSTPEQVVTTQTQDGQNAIEIQPADPQVIYVPVYQPEYVWGPPAWGAYPDLWYPPGLGFDFGFESGIFMGGLFPGWGGWGGWGWGCGWFGNGLFVNAGFFNRYGFRGGFGGGFGGRGFAGRGAWAHDPGHRMGVPYPNQAVAGQFNSNRFNGSGRNGGQFNGGNRSNAGQFNGGRSNAGQNSPAQSNRGSAGAGGNGGGWRSFNGGNRAATSGYGGSYRQASPNYRTGSASQAYRGPAQSYRGYNSAPRYRSAPSYNRSFAPAYSGARSYSPPRQSFSAPRSSGGGFSGGRSSFSGGHSGFSGGHGGGGRR
jgi:hypothetical protein